METGIEEDLANVEHRRIGSVTVAWLVAGLSFALFVGAAAGWWTTTRDSADTTLPAPDSVDAGFAQDMSLHHNQAVEMAGLALVQAADPAVRNLAYDILTTQQSQIGTMQGWLTLWNLPAQTAGPYMLWIDAAASEIGPSGTRQTTKSHQMPDDSSMSMPPGSNESGGGGVMPGMASSSELRALRRSTGADFDVKFLQLVLRHHEGGMGMARYASENSDVGAVRSLAERIVATQSAEVQTMRAMLADRDAQPLPMR